MKQFVLVDLTNREVFGFFASAEEAQSWANEFYDESDHSYFIAAVISAP